MLAWNQFDTILLDLDGTLLDLAYDNYFWQERVPRLYADAMQMDVAAALDSLRPEFKRCEGTLDWYCIDHWSRTLGLDIPALKRADAHRIAWLPGAREFLGTARVHGKRLVLVTNAHPETLRIKDERTGVTQHLDAAFSSHAFGVPKENARFWTGLRAVEPYDAARTLFVDDSLNVLHAARAAGIAHIRAIRRPDTGRPEREITEFESVSGVAALLPPA